MITRKLQTDIVDYVYNKINSIKLIINNTTTTATIKSKIKGVGYIDIYVDVSFSSSSDILNGAIIYDSSNNILAKELPNLTYNVQSATYIFRLKILSNEQILEE